jgi:septal ring factor EnvC (AmiA/AmiB activator)
MRTILLAMLVACSSANYEEPKHFDELDKQIDDNWKLIQENKKEIDELLKSLDQIGTRAAEIRKMVDCTVAALDSKMNDRDQVLTIDECFRVAGYRP